MKGRGYMLHRFAPLVLYFVLFLCSAFSQPSLQPGIAQTQAALNQIDNLLLQNQNDLGKLFADQGVDFAGFGGIKTTVDLVNALHNGDWAKAIQNSGDALADLWGQVNPTGPGGIVKSLADVTNKGFQVAEAQMLQNQETQLADLHHTLEMQLYRLEGQDPKDLNQSWWNDILKSDDKLQQAFQNWLAQNNVTKDQVAGQAALDGLTIVEPDQQVVDLTQIPGINPDFIAALQQCSQENNLVSTAGYIAAMNCDKYPDGSYIPAFLTSDGTTSESSRIQISSQLVNNSIPSVPMVSRATSVYSEPAFGNTPSTSGGLWQNLATALSTASQIMQAYQAAKGHSVPAVSGVRGASVSQPASSSACGGNAVSSEQRGACQLVQALAARGLVPTSGTAQSPAQGTTQAAPTQRSGVNCFYRGPTMYCVGNPNFPH